MDSMKISIIIATKNRERFLLSLINNLINQDFEFDCFEVCVIDNSSVEIDFTNVDLGKLNFRYFINPNLPVLVK